VKIQISDLERIGISFADMLHMDIHK